MKRPLELSSDDFPNSDWEPDGCDMKEIPAFTRENFHTLIENYNNLVEVVNYMASINSIDLDELA